MLRKAALAELRLYAKGKCPPDYMRMIGVERFAEIGVRRGISFFNRHVHGASAEAYAIDIWRETGNPAQNDGGFSQSALNDQYSLVMNKSEKWNKEHTDPKVYVIRDFSLKAAEKFRDGYFDWVFLDADHSYKGCREDIETWYEKLQSGGVLCGHDYMIKDTFLRNIKVGVKQAVDGFCEKNGLEFYVYAQTEFPTWYLVKP